MRAFSRWVEREEGRGKKGQMDGLKIRREDKASTDSFFLNVLQILWFRLYLSKAKSVPSKVFFCCLIKTISLLRRVPSINSNLNRCRCKQVCFCTSELSLYHNSRQILLTGIAVLCLQVYAISYYWLITVKWTRKHNIQALQVVFESIITNSRITHSILEGKSGNEAFH